MSKLSKRATIVAFVLLITLGIVGGAYILIRNSGSEITSKPDKQYEFVVIKSKDKATVYGIISVNNGKVIYSKAAASEIDTFIEANKLRWETSKLSYPTGGKTANGTYWDGTAMTDISKPDCLIAIYVEFDEKFGNKFEINLKP